MTDETQPAPRLSVVLATYNRAETLRLTLARLADQTLAPEDYEIIVVDDGSPDQTAAVVADLGARIGPRVTYLHHQNRGPGYTINRGIRAARAPLLLLIADDILFTREALQAHLEMHASHPEREVAVLGMVLQDPDLDHTVFLRHWDPFRLGRLRGEVRLPFFLFWACNVSLKRDFMLEHGMFRDPKGRGGAPAHEDVEVGYRLARHGLRLLFCERALGYHHHVYTLEQAVKRYYDRGINWGEFRRLVPDPSYLVFTHLLNRETWREYRAVLAGPNDLVGRDRHFGWHLARAAVRVLAVNRLSVALLWRPLLRAAEHSAALARLMSARVYAAYLFYHFERGIRDARAHYGD